MLNSIKSFIKKRINAFGYEIKISDQISSSDDPIFILSKILTPDKVRYIIDGGASIGNTSIRLSNLFPKAKVFSIDPYPPFFNALTHASKLNPNISAHNTALSNYDGISTLNINMSEDTNSLLNTNKENSKVFGDLLAKKDQIEVVCTTLDSFTEANSIENIDILKLDLQGYELMALQGATKILQKQKVGILLCEIIFEDIYEGQTRPYELINFLIKEHSFKFFNFYQKNYHQGRLLQADIILFHESLLDIINNNCENSFHPYSNLLL
jgi:FkbM family methyltransferase